MLDDATHTIVGVMPRDFQFPPNDPDVELWSPLTLNLERARVAAAPDVPRDRPAGAGRDDRAGARRRWRRSPATSRARIPTRRRGWGVTLVPAHEQVVGKIGDTLWVLFGAVVLVLVIACANIANLLLARSATRGEGLRAVRRRSAPAGGRCCAARWSKARC